MLVVKSMRLADELHKGQVRKGNGHEYIAHPIGCSYLLAKYKPNSHRADELISAMILHDVLEDCDITFHELAEQTTPLVASLVLELSNDKTMVELIGKGAYQLKKMLGMSSWALTLKLIDFLYNVSDQPSEKRKAEIIETCSSLGQKRNLSNTQKAIIADILSQ
jgi:guanosine-3',5'-bis(diphosphate) 3'-pyrophosphohydrolase